MKIVVLDGYTLNPGDLSWKALSNIGEVEVYDRTPDSLIISRSKSADILLVNKIKVTADIIAQLPNLKYIGMMATGHDNVDSKAARAKNIPVCNAAGYSVPAVAQHTIALLLELTNRVGHHSEDVAKGGWANQPNFAYWNTPLVELHGKTMGIVGLGNIGIKVAQIAIAMGMKVIARTRTAKHLPGITLVKMDELFQKSDVVSLHCPLTPNNKEFVNTALLKTMKPSAFLINTARGGLINDEDLANALSNGIIAGAGIDVLPTEPPTMNHPFFKLNNCIITPHHAWATQASRQRLMDIMIENIQKFQAGQPQNVVNP